MPAVAYDNLISQLNLLTYEQLANMMHITIDLMKFKQKEDSKTREIGKYDGEVKITFADDWEMSEEELCGL